MTTSENCLCRLKKNLNHVWKRSWTSETTTTTNKTKITTDQLPQNKNKRTHVSNESIDYSTDLPDIQPQLDAICGERGDLNQSLQSVLKKVEALITNTIVKIMTDLENKLNETMAIKVTEKTKELQNRI